MPALDDEEGLTQGLYAGYRRTPGQHLREAEKILVDRGPSAADLAAMSWTESVIYADALIALATAQMTGATRR